MPITSALPADEQDLCSAHREWADAPAASNFRFAPWPAPGRQR